MGRWVDHYDALGVKADADRVAIEAGLRRRTSQLHPHENRDVWTRARLGELSAAIDVVLNSRRRAEYDKSLPRRANSFVSPLVQDMSEAAAAVLADRETATRAFFHFKTLKQLGVDPPRQPPEWAQSLPALDYAFWSAAYIEAVMVSVAERASGKRNHVDAYAPDIAWELSIPSRVDAFVTAAANVANSTCLRMELAYELASEVPTRDINEFDRVVNSGVRTVLGIAFRTTNAYRWATASPHDELLAPNVLRTVMAADDAQQLAELASDLARALDDAPGFRDIDGLVYSGRRSRRKAGGRQDATTLVVEAMLTRAAYFAVVNCGFSAGGVTPAIVSAKARAAREAAIPVVEDKSVRAQAAEHVPSLIVAGDGWVLGGG